MKNRNKCYSLFIFWLLALNSFSQISPICKGAFIDSTQSPTGSLTYSSQAYKTKYGLPSFYVPDVSSRVFTVNITVHVFTPEAPYQDSGIWVNSLTNTVNGLPRLNHLLAAISEGSNDRYSGLPQSTYSVPNYTMAYLHDSKIQYHVTNVYFYASTQEYYSNSTSYLYVQAYNGGMYKDRLNEGIPIFLNAGDSAEAFNGRVYSSAGPDSASFVAQMLHELGHCFGLLHPYFGVWSPTGQTEIPTPENINCSSGNLDFISDLFPLNNPNCPAHTPPNPPTNTSCNDCYETQNFGTNNFMTDFNLLTPKNWITPLQMGRKRKALSIGINPDIRRYVADMRSDHAHPWEINTDELWDFDIQMYNDIIVKSGHKLTINGTVGMAIGGKITVEKNAQLIIEGGTVTGWCKTGLWSGIELEGTPSQPQTLNASGFSTYHGVLRMTPLGTLSHCENAIKTYRTDSLGNIDWSTLGGIIIANGAMFTNNTRSVEFLSFTAGPSASTFSDCLFWTIAGGIGKTVSGDTASPLCHVTLWNIDGVRFLGCRFECDISTYDYPKFGYGIYTTVGEGINSIDASYIVDNSSTGPCSFFGLRRGILVQNSNPLKVPQIRHAQFTNNVLDAAYFQNTEGLSFYDNTMYIRGNGVYLLSSKDYMIQSNLFSRNTYTGGTGIYAYNSTGGAHQIYRNTFAKLGAGIVAVGNNSGFTNLIDGLKMNCNTFTSTPSNQYDVALMIAPTNTLTPGFGNNNWPSVASFQGQQGLQYQFGSDCVRNIYGASSSCNTCENQWYIEGHSAKRINHPSTSNSAAKPLPQPALSDDSVKVIATSISFNYAASCPTLLPAWGGNPDDPNDIPTGRVLKTNMYKNLSNLQSNNIDGQNQYEIEATTAGLLNYFLTDSLPESKDSAIALLENYPGNLPNADVLAIYAYMNKGDFTTAATKINSLPDEKEAWADLLTKQLYFQQHPSDLYNLKKRGADINFLMNYAAYDSLDGSAAAQSMLKAFGGKIFNEPRPFPYEEDLGSRHMAAQDVISNAAKSSASYILSAYPNPTKDKITLKYAGGSATLQVILTDALGRKLYENNIQPESALEIPMTAFSNGLYFLTASEHNTPIYKTKVTLSK